MQRLVESLIHEGVVTTKRVAQAMVRVDRGQFCDPYSAYLDSP